MRIAYVAPYQGPNLVKQRPCLRNLSLGGSVKMELIAELLNSSSHQVEIISQGEVIEREFKFYPAFSEREPFHRQVPIHYSSAFPARFVNGFWSNLSTLRHFKARHRVDPFDLVLIYNLKTPQVACANYALKRLGLPAILEYEDDQFGQSDDRTGGSFFSGYHASRARNLLGALSGCLSNSPALLAQVTREVPKFLLCGVVSQAILEVGGKPGESRLNRVVFSGTHSKAQGLEQLIGGWRMAKLPGWELHIAGRGAMTDTLHGLAQNDSSIIFHGLLNREDNARMLGSGKIAIVPYDVSSTLGFSFKTIECLAAGLHVITTRLRALEGLSPQLKAGITYLDDNAPATIAACLQEVITRRQYERTAVQATANEYGPAAVSQSLGHFLQQVMKVRSQNRLDMNHRTGKLTAR